MSTWEDTGRFENGNGSVSSRGNTFVNQVADDPYFRYVMERTIDGSKKSPSEGGIDHEVTDWHEEMRQHSREKYDASQVEINAAFLECAENIRQERLARGEA